MITKPVPALLCTPTGHGPTNRPTPELAQALTPDPVALQARVDAMTKRMGAGAFKKTVGGLHVPVFGGGLDLFAVGAQADISEAQIGLANAEDEALRIYPKLPSRAGAEKIDEPYLLGRNHAEGNCSLKR